MCVPQPDGLLPGTVAHEPPRDSFTNEYTLVEHENYSAPSFNQYNAYLMYNKKMSIVYNNNLYDLNYYVNYKEFDANTYYIDDLYIQFPNEVPITPNTLYPIVISDSEFNTIIPSSICTNVNNIGSLGAIQYTTGDITFDDSYKYNVLMKNDNVL